ncbi:MAG: DUF4412 domain-containing protein [Flavobacteriales bacterium]|nr:DUF4412 domain-containing protein [Flavobacteriales bacterium]MBP6641615.1 DUF4412 domain-containing protein [Flavobacteriales bacterium]MBP7155175.1 DUF4412 domain-containing protein [Flavobacteriales bacterium]HQV75812.1 DUF4412 domain-containing protein [Flavobacteriales bacterium]HQW41524.1 DUF4412 domain-containing protein [Flavobacteriales bacterium]
MLFNLRSLSLTLFSFVLASASLQAQNFEGVIEFTKTTGPVVTNYRYYVKGDRVRIEEISARGDVQGIMLVDTRDKTVLAISPERKLYMDVPNMRLPKSVTTTVQKTSEMKEIAGYKCEKWVVKSPTEDRNLTYWVAADDFNFFVPLLETLNRKDEQALFFLEISDNKGVFPMVGMENKMDGAEISRLEVSKVTKGPQKPAMFEIPPGFNKFERN